MIRTDCIAMALLAVCCAFTFAEPLSVASNALVVEIVAPDLTP